jgi:DNA polymerase V
MDKPYQKRSAEDPPDDQVGLSRRVFKNPSTTLMLRMEGDGFENSGVFDGDLLVADCLAEPHDRQLVVASIGGRQVVRQFEEESGRKFLTAGGAAAEPVELREGGGARVLAVVTHTIPTLED